MLFYLICIFSCSKSYVHQIVTFKKDTDKSEQISAHIKIKVAFFSILLWFGRILV